MQLGSRSAVAGLSALVALPAAWLTGCSADMIAGMEPEVETAPPHGRSTAVLPGPDSPGTRSNALIVSPHQQSYLDALADAGVEPSSELSALSIGSYVCQARAAGQTDQAVWDFVEPLVRNDIRDADAAAEIRAELPSPDAAHSTTADYIRIATDRLC